MKPEDLHPETLEYLIDEILYGDIHETSLDLLFSQQGKPVEFDQKDEESFTRVSIAATLADLLEKAKSVRFSYDNGCPNCGNKDLEASDRDYEKDEYLCWECRSIILVYDDDTFYVEKNAL